MSRTSRANPPTPSRWRNGTTQTTVGTANPTASDATAAPTRGWASVARRPGARNAHASAMTVIGAKWIAASTLHHPRPNARKTPRSIVMLAAGPTIASTAPRRLAARFTTQVAAASAKAPALGFTANAKAAARPAATSAIRPPRSTHRSSASATATQAAVANHAGYGTLNDANSR